MQIQGNSKSEIGVRRGRGEEDRLGELFFLSEFISCFIVILIF